MSRVPLRSARQVVNAFVRGEWQVARQTGSHIILVKPGHQATLSVPNHREVARGTLRSLIRQAGLTIEVSVHRVLPQRRDAEAQRPAPRLCGGLHDYDGAVTVVGAIAKRPRRGRGGCAATLGPDAERSSASSASQRLRVEDSIGERLPIEEFLELL